MLRIELIGNLGSDPELRYTAKGMEMLSFRVAVNSVKGRDEERKERTDWFRVMVSGGRARYLADLLHKGSRVLAIGRYEIGEWTTREGEVRASHDVWADDVQNLSPREDGGRSQGESTSSAPSERPAQPVGAGARRAAAEDATDLEDLPF